MGISRKHLGLVSLLLPALLVIAACAKSERITYIPDGATYTMDEALTAGRAVPMDAADGLTAEEAPKARQDALASLRSRDADASAFADLVTRTFPAGTRSVPVYAEAATVDGQPAWLFVEAWGGRSGPLDKRRIWVLDRTTGEVISSATAD